MKSSFFDVDDHMHTDVLWLSVFFGIIIFCNTNLRVPYGAHMGTVWALAGALRACEHP